MILYIFLFLSFVAVFCGLMTVLSKNPIHSALYLVVCFASVALHYLLLNSEFLFAVQFIVYAGAIMVLFLFTLMFLNFNEETEKHKPALARFGALLAAIVLGFVLVAILIKATTMPVADTQNIGIGTVKNLGKVLLDEYFFPFEFASVLFLSAMVGVVLLTKKDKTPLL